MVCFWVQDDDLSFSSVTRRLRLHLHGKDEEAGEGAEATLIKDAPLGPQGDRELVALLQDQRHAVGATAVHAPRVEDGKHVLPVLHQRCVQGPAVSNTAGEADVVESLHGGCEDACKATSSQCKILLNKPNVSDEEANPSLDR